MSYTPNGNGEPLDTTAEGAEDTTAPNGQATEPQQKEAEDGISPDEFSKELNKKSSEANAKKDSSAEESHQSSMALAAARVARLAREKEISQEEAAIELLDDGKLREDQVNYLIKRNFSAKQEETQKAQSFSKETLKAELRAEERLTAAVQANKISRTDASRLISDYRELAQRNSPEEASEFALYRAGITTKQIQDEAYRSGQQQVVRPPRGSSPTTPKPQPKSINSSTIKGMSIEEYNVLKDQELKELGDLRERGMA